MATYRKQLTVVTAEEKDIQEGTEFYSTDEVEGILNDVENEVNFIVNILEDYAEWTVDDLMGNLSSVYNKLKSLSDDLY
jgi:hypothetical protein